MTFPVMKRRETLGQITGYDLKGDAVTIWVDRDGQQTVLSCIAKGHLYRHTVDHSANLESEAARVFELTNLKFSRVH
jgi:hypothetical protein